MPETHHAVDITAVDDKYDGLRIWIIESPECARILSATEVPQRKDHLFMLNALDVEANGRDDLRVV